MYCPKCYSNTLFLASKGVIDIIINRKKRDAGRFLFTIDPSQQDKVLNEFEQKCDDFFSWYAQFQNKEPISSLELITSDLYCENGCRFSSTDKFSIVGEFFNTKILMGIIHKYGKKYDIPIDLKL